MPLSGQMRMRSAVAFAYHLAIATLGVPLVTVFSAVLVYWLAVGSVSSDAITLFYSSHVLSVTAVIGFCFGYLMGVILTGAVAMWVWVAPTVLFFIRLVAFWKSTSSALFHPRIYEHFFPAVSISDWRQLWILGMCIQDWRDLLFGRGSYCDPLFTAIMVGSLTYSAGMAIHLAIRGRRS